MSCELRRRGPERRARGPRVPRRKHRAPVDSQAIAPLTADLADDLACAARRTSVVAWRGGVRWQRHVLGDSRAGGSADAMLAACATACTYLITGGLGGIGGVIAEWLAREVKARLVLVGRTPLPQRADWDDWLARHARPTTASRSRSSRSARLEALGATVLPVAADVAVADTDEGRRHGRGCARPSVTVHGVLPRRGRDPRQPHSR
jgi:hypothetical protein